MLLPSAGQRLTFIVQILDTWDRKGSLSGGGPLGSALPGRPHMVTLATLLSCSHMLEVMVSTGWRRLNEISQGDGSRAESGVQFMFYLTHSVKKKKKS